LRSKILQPTNASSADGKHIVRGSVSTQTCTSLHGTPVRFATPPSLFPLQKKKSQHHLGLKIKLDFNNKKMVIHSKSAENHCHKAVC